MTDASPARASDDPGLAYPAGGPAPARRSEIDAIRILTCFSVIAGHVIAVFAAGVTYHIKNADLSPLFGSLYEWRHAWSMPAFFMMAGWSALMALKAKGVRVFLDNRVRRLGIPFLVGMILLAPVIKYFELRDGLDLRMTGPRTIQGFDMPFLDFLGQYFTLLKRYTWSHLWFLAYLMAMSVVAYPLLRALAKRGIAAAGVGLIDRLCADGGIRRLDSAHPWLVALLSEPAQRLRQLRRLPDVLPVRRAGRRMARV